MHFENEWYGLFARICLFQENWDWNCADLIQADLTWHMHNIVHNEYAHFSLKSDVTCKHEIYQFKLWQKMWFINLTRERKYKHGRKYKATQEQKDIDDELILMCLFLALLETNSHVDVPSDRYIEELFQPAGWSTRWSALRASSRLTCLLLALLETDHMAQLLMLRASSRLMCLLLDWPHVDGQLDRDIEYEEVFQPSGQCFGLFLVSCLQLGPLPNLWYFSDWQHGNWGGSCSTSLYIIWIDSIEACLNLRKKVIPICE